MTTGGTFHPLPRVMRSGPVRHSHGFSAGQQFHAAAHLFLTVQHGEYGHVYSSLAIALAEQDRNAQTFIRLTIIGSVLP